MELRETGTPPSAEKTVIIKRLNAEHGQDSFAVFAPLNRELVKEIDKNVKEIFDVLGGASLIKSSGDVYIKPNGVGADPYVHTRPEVVDAAIRYWFNAGARNIYLIENSSQGNYTRLVFEITGYRKICKKTGAIPVYLDEEETVPFDFAGKGSVTEGDPHGYELTRFGMPKTVAEKLIKEKDKNLYINIPKLKTHSMAVVTLGIKNQWGFPIHQDRAPDHNYNLHSKLVDVLSHVRPDVTLIEGVEGTIYGHYPIRAFADKCVRPFKVLIGGLNVVATDIVGARVFGLGVDDVPHIKIAIERGLSNGVENEHDIQLTGDYGDIQNIDILNELSEYNGKYPTDIYPELPENITIIKGKERACKEGCFGLSVGILQGLAFDYQGNGGWTLIAGKGFDAEQIERLKGPVFIVGQCAIKETGENLLKRLGRRRVYFCGECGDLRAMLEGMAHLMKLNPFKYAATTSLNPIKGLIILIQAKLNRSHGRQVNPLCSIIKLR